MWVSFPGLRCWWRSQAEKCPRSPRGEAGHSRLHVRAVEAPVCGGRTVSTSCWGSGVGGGGCKPQHGGPMGSRREVSVLGPRGPLLCWRLPRWDPMVWPGSSSGSFGMASGSLAVARGHTTSPTGLCHCRLFGTWAYMAALCQWLVRPVCWSPGLRPGVSRIAGSTLALLRCPLPSSVRRRCHVLDQEEYMCPRHSRAEVRSPERAVPSWLPCLYRPPP